MTRVWGIFMMASLLLADGCPSREPAEFEPADLPLELQQKRRDEGLAIAWIYGGEVEVNSFDGHSRSKAFPIGQKEEHFQVHEYGLNGKFVAGHAGSGKTPIVDLDADSAWTIQDMRPRELVIAPDGNSIALAGRDRSSGFEGVICVTERGKNTIQVAANGTSPSWSADGAKLVYEVEGKLFAYDVMSQHSSLLGNGSDPSWSPDGKWILYRSSGNQYDLMDPSGKSARPAFRGKDPRWSPDGNWIAYRSLEDRAYLAKAAGDSVQLLYAEPALTPASWSPDSQYLMFIVAGGKGCIESKQIRVYRLRDGGSMRLDGGCKGFPYQLYGWIKSKRLAQ